MGQRELAQLASSACDERTNRRQYDFGLPHAPEIVAPCAEHSAESFDAPRTLCWRGFGFFKASAYELIPITPKPNVSGLRLDRFAHRLEAVAGGTAQC